MKKIFIMSIITMLSSLLSCQAQNKSYKSLSADDYEKAITDTTVIRLDQGEGMDDGEKLADVVGAVDRTIVENLGTGLKVDALVFHRTGIAGTGGIHSPGVSYYLVWQRQNCIVSPCRRIYGHFIHLVSF